MAWVYRLSGRVHLSLPACERFLNTRLKSAPAYTMRDVLDEYLYQDDALVLQLKVKVCSEDDLDLLDDLLEALAAAKDVETIDELYYTDYCNRGRYYVRPRRWAYTSAPIPSVPPDDSLLWQRAA